jgi:antitoxin ParD1/3/4
MKNTAPATGTEHARREQLAFSPSSRGANFPQHRSDTGGLFTYYLQVFCRVHVAAQAFALNGNRTRSSVGLNPIRFTGVFKMRTTQQFSITLPNELAELVRAKVESGEYATDSEVIRDGLRTLAARDRVVESWLRDEVGPAYDALKADPSRALTVEQVRAALVAKRKSRA